MCFLYYSFSIFFKSPQQQDYKINLFTKSTLATIFVYSFFVYHYLFYILCLSYNFLAYFFFLPIFVYLTIILRTWSVASSRFDLIYFCLLSLSCNQKFYFFFLIFLFVYSNSLTTTPLQLLFSIFPFLISL